MAGKFRLPFLIFGFVLVTILLSGSRLFSPANNSISLVSPSACPSAGCVAGQRLNFKIDFNLSIFNSSLAPNVQVCVYAPINWSASGVLEPAARGGVTGAVFTKSTTHCENFTTPSGYDLVGGAFATEPIGSFGDSLSFAFRLGTTATSNGSVTAVVLEQSSSGWSNPSPLSFYSIPVIPTGGNVYVANDAAACSVNSPCYVNSADDLMGGFGTGLKDAIDSSSSPITIDVVGDYNIKSNSVIVNNAHTINGVNNARLDYPGGNCANPMLHIIDGATIKNLTISTGPCSTGNRTLLQVDSPFKNATVTIQSNDLLAGQDAIHVSPANQSAITVRYNHIQGNAGYGIFLDPANTGVLDAKANNIFGNRSGAQVDCGADANGNVDHNYWGASTAAAAISKCTFTENKRLGAAVQRNLTSAGVSAQLVSVTANRQNAFNSKIGYLHGSGASDFDLFIVNHGFGSNQNIPFTAGVAGTPISCSNYWDIFLASSSPPASGNSLNLIFKYDYVSPGCVSTIETARFCYSPNASDIPLYWYEIDANTWATTGLIPGGQLTTCSSGSDNHEIQVTIDSAGGRPDFNDLAFAPFVVGLPGQPTSATFSSFSGEPGDTKVTLSWTTLAEPNTNSFIVTRSEQQDSGYVDISSPILHTGTSTTGATYTYSDASNLVNNHVYYYRIKIINLDLTEWSSGTVSVTPFPSTATPTSTPTITPTPTKTPLPTYTFTRTWTYAYVYRTNTPTRTFTPTPTSPFLTVTNTLTPQATPSTTSGAISTGAPIPLVTVGPPPATLLAQTRETRTALARESETVTATPRPPNGGGTLTLTGLLVILAVVAAGAAAAIYYFRDRLRFPA